LLFFRGRLVAATFFFSALFGAGFFFATFLGRFSALVGVAFSRAVRFGFFVVFFLAIIRAV
jgi:hypothetical protein